jgi:hypothetical protein
MFKSILQSVSIIEKAQDSKKRNMSYMTYQDVKLKAIMDKKLKFHSNIECDTSLIATRTRVLRSQYESMTTPEKIKMFESSDAYMRCLHDRVREHLNLQPVVREVAAPEGGDPSSSS